VGKNGGELYNREGLQVVENIKLQVDMAFSPQHSKGSRLYKGKSKTSLCRKWKSMDRGGASGKGTQPRSLGSKSRQGVEKAM